MTLTHAADALDELAAGRSPDSTRILLGVLALDPLLGRAGCDLALIEAAAALDLFLDQGMAPYHSGNRRTRASYLAGRIANEEPVLVERCSAAALNGFFEDLCRDYQAPRLRAFKHKASPAAPARRDPGARRRAKYLMRASRARSGDPVAQTGRIDIDADAM